MGEMVQTAYLDIFPPPFVVIASAHSALGVFPAFVIDITANGQWTEDTVIIMMRIVLKSPQESTLSSRALTD